MERAEKIGLGVATAGHVLLFGLLSAGFLATPNPLKLNSPPMDVSLVDEVALQSTAPRISTEPPPPSEAPEKGPTEDAAPAPEPEPAPAPEPTPAPPKPAPTPPTPKPAPAPKPAPPKKDVPKAAPKPKPAPEKPAPAKAKPAPAKPSKPAAASSTPKKSDAPPKKDAPARASGSGKADKPKGSLLGNDFLKGIDTSSETRSRPSAPAASAMGPQQKAALDAELRRQLKPHWRPPSGADADQLVTLLEVRLDKNGRVIGTPEVIDQLGVTASNRPQAQLHAERAIQAVKLASPFKNLPPEYYEQWKWLKPLRFDARLNR
ncbi:MAG: cell envelope biogenesis protein TolA [Sphingobium sp.]